jgi:cytochrome c biogenesis protein CcmG/thiol:disulfide interchange protein DsbE
MKSTLTIIKTLFFITLSFSQTKNFYMNTNGKIIDQETYNFQKNNLAEKFKKGNKSMQIVEENNELYQKNDSLVISYKWHITDSPKKTLKEINNKKLLIGKEYPILNENTLSGKSISLNDLKGKPTLINLWFTKCTPCIEEIPVLNNLKANYGEKFNFLAITMDSEDKVKKLLEKHKYDFDHIVNSNKLTKKLGFDGYPVNLFLDKNGVLKIIEGNVNYVMVDGELKMGDGMEFIKILEKLL